MSAFTNHVTMTPEKVCQAQSGVASCFLLFISVCMRGKLKKSSYLLYQTLHWAVGTAQQVFSERITGSCWGHTKPLKAAEKTSSYTAGQTHNDSFDADLQYTVH